MDTARRIPSHPRASAPLTDWHTGAMPESEDSPSPAPSDDPKERYRQALEQKKNRGGYGSSTATSGGSSAKGSSAKAGGKREFRRKSG